MAMDLREQYDKIYRYCYFRLNHRETAEDITQETFLRYFDSVCYRERGKSLEYLYTIARNLCIDEFRKRSSKQTAETWKNAAAQKSEVQNDAAMQASEMPDDADMEDETLTRVSIKRALRRLDGESQELLLLRYVNEVPVSVICSMMGISRFAVYRKIKNARKQLKEQLREEGFE